MSNLLEGLQMEIDRCQELLGFYEEIGPAGAFGAASIRESIKEGKAALVSGDDITRQIAACNRLHGHK